MHQISLIFSRGHNSRKGDNSDKKNKSFSYQDTLPLRSELICILNFDNKTSKIFSKCNHLSGRYLGETHFVHKSRAVTQLKNKEKAKCNWINVDHIYIYQCICKILLKFVYSFLRYWAKMHFGHESKAITVFLNEIIPLAIPYHSSALPMSMQCICKILLKFVYSFLRYWPKMYFGHKSRVITLLFLNGIIPFAIPYHPLRYQCLCKVWRKSVKRY